MTIWQSEAAAMGVDRELQEGWSRTADLLARMMPAPGTTPDDAARGARADAATRPAAVADAPDAGRELAALRDEIIELRRRIERLEAAPDRRRGRAAKA